MISKFFLRNKFRMLRDAAKSEEKDEQIYKFLREFECFKSFESVFIYYSVKSEVDTLKTIRKALADGKKVALPKCTDRNGNMEFYFVNDIENSLTDAFFTLKEPDTSVCELAVPDEKSVFIVPGMAFDKKGYRLGYGGGYYDRFLSNFKGMKIGLCFEECLCDCLPSDEHDIKVDFIITDVKIYETK